MATVRHFYINDQEVQIEISPQLANTLDETLDNLNVTEIASKNGTEYTPIETRFYIKDENNNIIQAFIVSADNVELATQNPLRYKHHLSLVQESEYLTKHEIRNTVFSNPFFTNNFKAIASATVIAVQSSSVITGIDDTITSSFNYISSSNIVAKINLDKYKIKRASCQIRFNAQIDYFFNLKLLQNEWHVFCNYSEPERWNSLYENASNQEYVPTNLPTLLFKIGTDELTWTIESDSVKNGDTLQLPTNVMSWIQSHSTGTLEISIRPASNNSTFMVSEAFSGAGSKAQNTPLLTNLSFEFNFQTIVISIYDVIRTLLNQYRKDTEIYHDAIDLFKMPTADHNLELYNLLKNTNAPNFVFTQSTMYDALVETFKLFDAIFTIDNEGYLDIEYFNDSQTKINEPKKAGKTSSLSEQRFTNRLITYFQNTKINDRFPNSNSEKATAYMRSKTLGVPSESDFVFVTPKPIDIVTKAMLLVDFSLPTYVLNDVYYHWGYVAKSLLDITDNIVEEEQWSILPANTNFPIDGDWQNKGKFNCFSYKRGSKDIDVGGFYSTTLAQKQSILTNVVQTALNIKFGIGGTANYDLIDLSPITYTNYDTKMSVEYIALVDGKLVNESLDKKYNGETLINQSNGSIDINKLGLNMVGLSLKLGQPTLNMTQVFSKWDDRVKKGQYFIDENGDRWVANNCVYTIIKPDLVQTNIEFIKNFNSLATRIELNSEKRLSLISNELTVKCEETYGEFVYYSSREINDSFEPISIDGFFLYNQIAMGFGAMLPDGLVGTMSLGLGQSGYYVESVTCDTALSGSHTKRKLYLINGCFVQNNPDIDGYLQINDQQDGSGATTLNVPLYGADSDSIIFNQLTREFEYKINLPFPSLSKYEEIYIYLIIDENGNIEWGAIYDWDDTSAEPQFDPTKVQIWKKQNSYTIEYALLTAYDGDDIINLSETGDVQNIAIPMVVYGSGNSVCFEMSYDSPISAGNQLRQNSPLWTSGWFSSAVLYTAKDGTAEAFTIDFVLMQEELTRCFPAMKKEDGTLLETFSMGSISKLKYYKKSNEIFALNYQIHFMPTEKMRDFLGNEFIKNNGFANGLNIKTLKLKTRTNNDEYSILDIKAEGTDVLLEEITPSFINGTEKIIFKNLSMPDESWQAIKSWAICDEDDNIYFATNTAPSEDASLNTGEFAIYFKSRHHRI